MNKAFTKESDFEDDEPEQPETLPANFKNYMTPPGCAALRQELQQLLQVERPQLVEVVSWAAGNGDRSENADYIYGKRRLREIDRRIRYLSKRLDQVIVVNPSLQKNLQQVFFGAKVTYKSENGTEKTVTLVGVDEIDLAVGKISWVSPVAKALMKAQVGDKIEVHTPAGLEVIAVLNIEYDTK